MTTESRSQPAGPARPLLSTEINTATRSVGAHTKRDSIAEQSSKLKLPRTLHTKLNRLITARLPLALPPHANSPRLYAFGLLHFAHVYLTFESAWHDLTQPPTHNNPALSSLLEDPWISVSTPSSTPDSPPQGTPTADHTADTLAFLATLLPPGLPRSRRLRRDLSALLGLRPVELDVRLATGGYPGGGAVAAYAAHIRQATSAAPHVLVAYAWVMYMAVFAGGRWIRGQLRCAGREFWVGGDAAGEGEGHGNGARARGIDFDTLADRGLAFFSFDGDADGEDVKAAFKARLAEAEALFDEGQRADVVEEARRIFEWSIALVEELDELLDTPPEGDRRPAEVMAHGAAAAPVSEKSEKGFVSPPSPVAAAARSPSSPRKTTDWVRQGGSVAGALVVLGGVYWWAACFLGTALREGWHEGWAGI
ncbi:hypothetical protein SLS55_010593 [Diplodia seriata]|uniref:Heme oxygenase-like protein n=1 Tax=Diplodia seriata TaxID=420778 RepID=A0ABR3BYC6_9PEZI